MSGHATSSNAVGRPMEILFVEDSLTSARLTMGALRKSAVQHRLTWIKNGLEAMEFLQRTGKYAHAPRPDLILLDLELPGMDGREILTAVRSDDDLREIPVVILTTSQAEQDVLKAYQLSANAYITKPVDLDQFFNVVRSIDGFWFRTARLAHR